MIRLTDKGLRWLSAILFVGSLVAALWRAPTPPAPAFSAPPPATPSQLPAQFSSQSIAKGLVSANAASLTLLPDGRIAAAWLAGTQEDADDVSIWFSLLGKNSWSAAKPIADRASTAGGTFSNIRKIGNPVLYAEGSWLHLWYVSASIGGWAGSSINHSLSTDAGSSWFKPTKLQTSPFANISTLVSTPPVALADGGIGLPIYHAFIARHGEWLRLSATGQIIDKVRLAHDVRTRQPSVAVLDQYRALALLRDAGQIQRSSTSNAGLTWQAGEALAAPKLNSSIALLRMRNGCLLLAGSTSHEGEAMRLWISSDEGKTWAVTRTVDSAPDGGAEFSYPALVLDRDGRIHLAYTSRRQEIKHAVFSEAWLAGGPP